ncbi:MAG: acyl-CoA synthetase, partial [Candidatus Eremiobacteraeota bacterium]|nr:acyl-CoA synthetase [Candidatus Eremiobacteraeota bacterium]
APRTYEAIRRSAEAQPDRLALRFLFQGTDYERSVDYTYSELMANLHRTANMFTSLGIGPNDVVSTIMPNLPQTFFTIFGAEAVGIVNPINPLLEPHVMAEIMNAARTKVLVTVGPFVKTDIWQKVVEIADQVPSLETILQVRLGSFLGGAKKLLGPILAWSVGRKLARPSKRVEDFDKLRSTQPSGALVSGRKAKPEDIASYFHTGGTTGVPKLAQHTHANEVYDAWVGGMIAQLEGKTLFCGLPLFHVNGVILTGLAPWSMQGTTVLGSPAGYRGEGILDNFWKITDRYKINFFSGVPTVYSTLLNKPIDGADVSSLEACICGAAPMPVEVFKQFEKRTNLKILEGYGLTEATCASSANPLGGERRIGSVGLRFPYQEMKTVLLDEQGKFERDCQTMEIGTVVMRGPNVFPGYKEDFHNQGIWIDCQDGGAPWLNTGDLGRQDAEGYFWLTGRKKELIIRGGHNIDPKLIEEPLCEHEAVAMAAAVGRPDAHAGEVPVAYVQLKPGVNTSEAALLEFCQNTIGERAAVPKSIHILAELPLTPVGKIFKPDLVRRQITEVYNHTIEPIDGVARFKVIAEAHKQFGTLARVQLEATPEAHQAVEEALGAFTVRYQLEAFDRQLASATA